MYIHLLSPHAFYFMIHDAAVWSGYALWTIAGVKIAIAVKRGRK